MQLNFVDHAKYKFMKVLGISYLNYQITHTHVYFSNWKSVSIPKFIYEFRILL